MRLWFRETAVFWVFGFVSAQLQGFPTCAFAKASPKNKNPSCPSLPLFCQCSIVTRKVIPVKSARGLAQSKTLARLLLLGRIRELLALGRNAGLLAGLPRPAYRSGRSCLRSSVIADLPRLLALFVRCKPAICRRSARDSRMRPFFSRQRESSWRLPFLVPYPLNELNDVFDLC